MVGDWSGYSQLVPQGVLGTQVGSVLGGLAGNFFGQGQLGSQIGGGLGSFLPFSAGPQQFPQQFPQLMPQGILGSQLGQLLGGAAGGLFGQSGLGSQLGSTLGNLLPFAVGPQQMGQMGGIFPPPNPMTQLSEWMKNEWAVQPRPFLPFGAGSTLGNLLPFAVGPQQMGQSGGMFARLNTMAPHCGRLNK